MFIIMATICNKLFSTRDNFVNYSYKYCNAEKSYDILFKIHKTSLLFIMVHVDIDNGISKNNKAITIKRAVVMSHLPRATTYNNIEKSFSQYHVNKE